MRIYACFQAAGNLCHNPASSSATNTLIELTDDHLKNLDDVLPRMLLRFDIVLG